MPSLKQTAATYLSAALMVAAGCQLSAFEQGTYFIYQLIEQSDAPVIDKRLAVDRQLFVEPETAPVKRTTAIAKRSEFETNYNSFGTAAGNSDFKNTQPISTELQTTSGTSAFDIGTPESTSLFGN